MIEEKVKAEEVAASGVAKAFDASQSKTSD
jgi:hypothetical protein